MRIAHMVVMLIAAIFSEASLSEEVGCEGSYSSVFHLDGVKAVKGWDGISRPQVFDCYAEVNLSRDLKVVVHSDKTVTGFGDDLYDVKLSLVSTSVETPKVLQSIDLTGAIPVHVEQPGNFYHMNAIGELLKESNGLLILHVNVWAEISGAGAISGSTDLLYLLEQNRLLPILEIRDSNLFSKENISNTSQKLTGIFFASKKGSTRIYLQPSKIVSASGVTKKTNSALAVYEFHEGKFKPIQVRGKLPAHAVKLKMVSEIALPNTGSASQTIHGK